MLSTLPYDRVKRQWIDWFGPRKTDENATTILIHRRRIICCESMSQKSQEKERKRSILLYSHPSPPLLSFLHRRRLILLFLLLLLILLFLLLLLLLLLLHLLHPIFHISEQPLKGFVLSATTSFENETKQTECPTSQGAPTTSTSRSRPVYLISSGRKWIKQ